MIIELILTLLALSLSISYLFVYRKKRQLAYIKNYKFPTKVLLQVKKAYPHLSDEDILEVINGLKDYFYICRQAKGEIVGMPSQVVDLAWHEFILFTREYQDFCKKAFGKFHHHIPSEAMSKSQKSSNPMAVAWRYACEKEYIYPSMPTKIPLLFAIDRKLNIEDGFKYTLNCTEEDAICVKGMFPTNSNKNSSSTGGGCGGGGGCSGDSGCSGGCGGGCGG